MKKVEYTHGARRDLKAIGHVAGAKVVAKVELYAANPAALANQIKKLNGINLIRLRVGDYRVLFTETGLVVLVAKVGHRREVYE